MPKILNVQTKCYICGTQYSGSVLGSYYSGLPKPEVEPLVCPQCHAPYKPLVTLQVGMAKEILLNLLESESKAENILFRFVRTESELDEWVNYLKTYVTEKNFEEWKTFNKKIKSKTEDGSINKLTNILKNGVLREMIIKISNSTRKKIQEDNAKYKRS